MAARRRLTPNAFGLVPTIESVSWYSQPCLLEYLYKYVYSMCMQCTWDEAKRRTNLRKHGLDFVDAPTVFTGPTFTFEDDRFAYGEQRFIARSLTRPGGSYRPYRTCRRGAHHFDAREDET